MTAAECIHDMAPGTCSVCTGRGEEGRDEREPSEFGPVFTACYAGHCVSCGEWFGKGAQIRSDGNAGRWLCAQCGGTP